jgi:phytoene dehydrogenase-like protein
MSAGRYDAIVIGAGHNGLVTATCLARAGRRTLVLERSDRPGGCAVTDEVWPGFRVDSGAHEFVALDRRVMSELGLGRNLETVAIDPMVASLQSDGPALRLYRDASKAVDAIRAFSERDATRWPAFVQAMGEASQALRVLSEAAPPRVAGADRADLFELARLGMRLGRVGRADTIELMRLLPMTVEELLDEWFEGVALKGALAALGCRGIRQGPLGAGTAFMLIRGLTPDAPPRAASWLPGGMGRLGEVLADAASGAGAEIRCDAAVAELLVQDGAIAGVALESGDVFESPIVASSADPRRTLFGLIDPVHLDPDFLRQVANYRDRGTCAKVHLALDAMPGVPGTDEACPSLCVAPSIEYLERAYDDAKYGGVSQAPHLEALVPSLLDSSMAPEGRTVMSVLVQYAPYDLRDGEWDDDRRDSLADSVVRTLDARLPGLANRVVHRQTLTPVDLETRFGLSGGHMHHGEMTLDQMLIGRPVPGRARYEMPVSGLYLCGAGTHPGGGLTGSPGMNAARRILG